MDKENLKRAVNALFDRPLRVEDLSLFVNREKELEHLTMICNYQPMGIFGLCGETGIGKTTILKFLNKVDAKTLFLVLTEKDSKEFIIGDLLYKMALAIEKEKKFRKFSETIKNWVVEERTAIIQAQFQAGVGISGGVSKGSSVSKKFNIYEASQKISEFLSILKKEFGKTILLIDELDKEEKNDVLAILDSIKNEFLNEGIITIISLPFSIYREYANDRMKWNESGNLKNIFKDMVFLDPLNDKDIETMLLKRLSEFTDLFSQGALRIISRFADGNPRDALWITQKILLNGAEKDYITDQFAEKIVRSLVKEYYSYGRPLTEKKKKILSILAKEQGDRTYFVEILIKNKFKRTTAYMTIDRLIKEGLLLDRKGIVKISGKAYYAL